MNKKIETEIVGIAQGSYDDIELIPNTTKREETFNEIVEALTNGKFYVMREGYTKNSVYITIKKLREKANINVSFAKTRTAENLTQFVLFVKKD